jgi:hypothetical protein
MQYVVVLVTLSALHPCPPASVPVPGCQDVIERMYTTSLAMCEVYAAWWREHARVIEADEADRHTAVCVEKPEVR